jgi:hypothetical protein
VKLLLLLASVLLVLLTAFGVFSIGVGRARTESNELAALGLGLCSGKPCYMGITPGKTTWNVATDFTYGYRGFVGTRVLTANNTRFSVSMHPDADTSHVNAIQFERIGTMPRVSIGHFIQLYGLPCAVISENPKLTWFQYPFGSVDIDLDDGRFTSQSPIGKIIFTTSGNDMCMYGGPLTAHPWSGFASARHYQLVRVWK